MRHRTATQARMVSVTGHGTPSWVRDQLGYNPTIAQYREAMGIDWMNRDGTGRSPPTEWIGHHLLAELGYGAWAK